jgi:hypothetical protein
LKAEYWVLKVSSIQLKLGFGQKLARELMGFTKKSFTKNIFQMFAPIPSKLYPPSPPVKDLSV